MAQAIHNIEPALAFQLELSWLLNYKLTPCLVEAKQIHIYHAIARENQLDNRFFIVPLFGQDIRIRSSGIPSFRKPTASSQAS